MNAVLVGALLGGTGVLLGAFAAHGLCARLDARGKELWETAVRYQFVHALAVLGVAALGASGASSAPTWTVAVFATGVILFSGSLYALALGAPRGLGAVTPLGGVALLAGWGGLAAGAVSGA